MKGHILIKGQAITLPVIRNAKPILIAPLIPGYPKTSAALKKLMPKYRFSRAKWYEATYNWMNQVEVVEWCTEQFGPHPEHPDAWSRWNHKWQDTIQFRDEKDYNWFVLRWGA